MMARRLGSEKRKPRPIHWPRLSQPRRALMPAWSRHEKSKVFRESGIWNTSD